MIWNPFATKEEFTLGIDIGTASIKAVQLHRSGNSVRLHNYAEFILGNGAIMQPGSFKMVESQVVQNIRELFRSAHISSKQAALSVPTFSSFSTLVRLPAMPENELARAVQFEARRFIPLPMSDVHFEWMKLEHISDKRIFKILIVAVPNEIIDKYYRIAERLGIEIKHLEIETFSAARALLANDTRSVLLLDMGSRATGISIVENGIAAIHHNVDTSGMSFTRGLAHGLSLNMERAERMKIERGLNEQQSAKLLHPLIDKIIAEIERVIRDYTVEGGSRPVRIVAHGGSVRLKGLLEYIQENTNVPTEYGNAFLHVQVPESLREYLTQRASQFAVSVGLALH